MGTRKKPYKKTAEKEKRELVMDEFRAGKLHSGSKKGPKVTNPRQAVAIAYSEAKKLGRKGKKR